MARLVILLRGVNLVSRNRVSMPVLREALTDEGFDGVATYLQSGNVVLTTRRGSAAVANAVAKVIEERFALEIGVTVRTRVQLAAVVSCNPLASAVTNAKLCQVTFLESKPDRTALEKLEASTVDGELVEAVGREIYTWHPSGVGRSKLARLLSGKALGPTATSRNWDTVNALLALAGES